MQKAGQSMRRAGMIRVLMRAVCCTAAAQTSDVRGAYETVIEGEQLRLIVTDRPSGTYSFELFEKYDEDVVFESLLQQDRTYRTQVDLEVLQLRFDDEGCLVADDSDMFYLFKRNGSPEDISGGYSLVMEGEGAFVLNVSPSRGGYQFRLETWESGLSAEGQRQESDVFRLENEWGDAFQLEFVSEACILRLEGSLALLLEKKSAGDLSAFIPTESGWWKTLPDFSVAGNLSEAFRAIYHAEPPASLQARAERLTVAKQGEFEFEGVPIHSLSPDGSKILANSPFGPLVFETRYGTLYERFERKGGFDDPLSVSWSPDSSRIVFTDNFFIFLREPDLHLIDLDSRFLVKLTEDDSENVLPRASDAGEAPAIDITATWLPDSRTILFQRYESSIGRMIRLYLFSTESSVAVPTSEVLTTLTSIMNLCFDYRSGAVYYTYSSGRRNDENGGIWRLQPEQTYPTQVLSALAEGWERASLVEIAFSGGSALIYHSEESSDAIPQNMRFALLDLMSLEVEDLEAKDHGPHIQYLNATFSPDGSKILYTYRDKEKERSCLAVRDVGGGPENVLLSSEDPFLGFFLKNSLMGILGLDWSVNDSVLVLQNMGASALLLELGVR